MAAGLGFKTFTTGEVLTAADTNGYLMQGVLVFASAAARDAAITSPQEGQFAYLKDTNVTTYYTGSAWANLDTTGMTNPMTTTGDMVYSSSGSTPARLGIGTTGQVITVAGGIPSWATPASGGGMTLIATATPSAATTVSFTSIPTTYKALLVNWVCWQSITSQFLSVQLNGSTTGYDSANWSNTTGSNSIFAAYENKAGFGADNDAAVQSKTGTLDNADRGIGQIVIYGANLNAKHQAAWSCFGGYGGVNTTKGYHTVTLNGITQLDFIRSSTGTITGTFYLYGLS
jgi:hypothetical protein